METKAEILLVDDHALILEGMQRMFELVSGVEVADAVTSGTRTAESIGEKDYDIYVLDVNLPNMSGFDLVDMIREINESARIIINTMHEEAWIINRLIRQKMNTVILKSSGAMEIENTVKNVLAGDSHTCPWFKSIRQRLSLSPVQIHPRGIPTKYELDVLKAVARGCNTHEAAAELKVSENTVETFRKRLVQKFYARNVIDMVVKVMAKGWIEIG